MSIQALVRIEGRGLDWESNLFGHAYDLFESLKERIGHPNPMEFASAEYGPEIECSDEEVEALQQQLADTDEGAAEILLSQRGPFYDANAMLSVIGAYKHYFHAQPQDKKFKAGIYLVSAQVMAEDLSDLEAVLVRARDNNVRARIYVG